jgi:anti-anti-sigma factor
VPIAREGILTEQYSIRADSYEGTATIQLGGGIDVTARQGVLSVVADAVFGARPGRVVIDLTETTSVDASGIDLLALACHAAESVGADYEVTAGPRTAARALELSGLRLTRADHHQ